jgi:hypothetical protein
VLNAHSDYTPAATSIPLVPLAIAVLGGVSVMGGRGGVAGTVLAALAMSLFTFLMEINGASIWAVAFLPSVLGLLVGIGLSLVFDMLERQPSRSRVPRMPPGAPMGYLPAQAPPMVPAQPTAPPSGPVPVPVPAAALPPPAPVTSDSAEPPTVVAEPPAAAEPPTIAVDPVSDDKTVTASGDDTTGPSD